MSVTKVTASTTDETTVLNETDSDLYTGSLTASTVSGVYDVSVTAYDDTGNVAVATASVDVTLWKTPKTDWVSTDKFNYVDYNRIKNNLTYLHQLAVSVWQEFEMPDMGEDITEYTAFWDADIFNLFESNLELINQNIYTQDFGISQKFYPNGAFIKWDELNRIESAILSMNELLESYKTNLRHIEFRLGRFREVRI